MLKFYFFIAFISIFVTAIYSGLQYIKNTEETISILKIDKNNLMATNTTNKNTIKELRDNQVQTNEALRNLQISFNVADAENNKLSEALSKRNLSVLAARKPQLVERAINNGTKEVLDVIQDITSPNYSPSSAIE